MKSLFTEVTTLFVRYEEILAICSVLMMIWKAMKSEVLLKTQNDNYLMKATSLLTQIT